MLKEIEKTTKEMQRFCDICEDRCKKACYICGIDVCPLHFTISPLSDPFDDYSEVVCLQCAKVMSPYVEQIRKAKSDYEDRLDDIEQAMKKECVKARKDEQNNSKNC